MSAYCPQLFSFIHCLYFRCPVFIENLSTLNSSVTDYGASPRINSVIIFLNKLYRLDSSRRHYPLSTDCHKECSSLELRQPLYF